MPAVLAGTRPTVRPPPPRLVSLERGDPEENFDTGLDPDGQGTAEIKIKETWAKLNESII